MIIKLLFELFKEFFELIHSPFIEDINKNGVVRVKQDEENGWRELSDDEDN